MKKLPVLISVIVSLSYLTGCNSGDIKLSSEGTNVKTAKKTSEDLSSGKLKNVETIKKESKGKKLLFDFFLGKKQFVFYNLGMPPAYALSQYEEKILSGLIDFINKWEKSLYQSLDEYDASNFLAAILNSGEKELLSSELAMKLKNMALILFNLKKLPSDFNPEFKEQEFRKLVTILFSKGFNLNYTSSTELENFLSNFNEITWKGRRNGIIDSKQSFKLLRNISTTIDRDDATKIKLIEQHMSRKSRLKNSSISISRYKIHLIPASERNMKVWLTFLTESKRINHNSFLRMFENLKSQFFPGMKAVPQEKIFKDEYLLWGGGQCSFCFDRKTAPGTMKLPVNIRKNDWRKNGEKISNVIFPREIATVFSRCFQNSSDFISEINFKLDDIKPEFLEKFKSRNLNRDIDDSEVLREIWKRLAIQLIAIQNSNLIGSLKQGCDITPFHYYIYSYMTNQILGKTNKESFYDELFIRLIAASGNLTSKTPLNPEENKIAVSDYFLSKSSLPAAYNRDALATSAKQLSEFFLTLSPEVLSTLGKRLNLSTPMINEKKLKDMRTSFEEALPWRRSYLPSHIKIVNGRVTYRHSIDAVNYFLDSYPRYNDN
ncbi:MAG: hypothetical protein JXR95_15840 [Deltaproteobacteria bacterium]|nr:hypothetical protein [Deltaproteobacteria bacterium]